MDVTVDPGLERRAATGKDREEIALAILGGILATLGRADDSAGALEYLEGPPALTESLHRRLCCQAFQLADAFIRVRDEGIRTR